VNSPTRWDILRTTLARLFAGPHVPQPDSRRDTILLDAAVAIRGRRYKDAAELLDQFVNVLDGDALYFNLCGVTCESRHDWQAAARFYGLAMSINPRLEPARLNMRRMYELNTFGSARDAVSLGDVELRARRQVPQHRAPLRARIVAV
jgi:hypothetical protein